MSISPGTTLGSFEVSALIGVGGMGEVYRARDTKLGREVAIKVLPEVFAASEERSKRFEREARMLAALDHPNIAGIHDFQEAEGHKFLVMQLVEGETLAERIKRGAIPADEALPIFAQIAEALEAAHEHGIVHRDLKPANIKVTEEGKVKVLDFGLAKAFEPEGTPAIEGATLALESAKEAITTGEGKVLGTPAYMSPEQARAQGVDKRSDIWAFGCCLYESLAGKRPFRGETASDLLAEILRSEPDWNALPAETPSRVRVLLWRCLQKDPKRRLRDIGDAWFEINETTSDSSGPFALPGSTVGETPKTNLRTAVAIVLALILGSVVTGLIVGKPDRDIVGTPSASTQRFLVQPESNARLSSVRGSELTMAPDGSWMAYVQKTGPNLRIFLRMMDDLQPRLVPGTEGGRMPFASPDSQWLGFFSESEQSLMKVRISGGTPLTICFATNPGGASWGEDGYIVFQPDVLHGLAKVSEGGGEPEPLTKVDAARGERSHSWPHYLPGGDSILYTAQIEDDIDNARIAVYSLSSGKSRVLLEGGISPHYAASGHLVYARGESLMAVPFRLADLVVTGSPMQIESGLVTKLRGAANFDFSRKGTLVYTPISSNSTELVWIDRDGSEQRLPFGAGSFQHPRVSPDGDRIALVQYDELRGKGADVWVYDVGGRPPIRLTFGGFNLAPVWSRDGSSIVFVSERLAGSVSRGIYSIPADGSAVQVELLYGSGSSAQFPHAWTPDEGELILYDVSPETDGDILALSLDAQGGTDVRPIIRDEFDEGQASISNDGLWLAYVSNRTGNREVYVRAFNGSGTSVRVSPGGGGEPHWSPDGRELYYRSEDRMMVVTADTQSGIRFGTPKPVFEMALMAGDEYRYPHSYDVAPDGKFLVVRMIGERAGGGGIVVVTHWFEELNRLVPTAEASRN